MATPIMAFGVILLLTSFLGCATAKMKTPCFAIPFGLISLVFGLILLVIAFLSLAMGTVLDQFTKVMCPYNDTANPRSTLVLSDQEYNEFIDKPMCSNMCPCKKNEGDANKQWPRTLTDE